jgi:DegV family protein with EDD domain
VAANVADYTELFSRLADKYDAVIHFNLSSKMSSCHQNAVIAAQEFENVYVIDTKNLSTGSGHLVLDAAIMAKEGRSAEEIIERVNGLMDKVEASFVIDSLKYLHKGGRCSGVAALGANVLKLKPCIEVKNGAMGVGKKYRGNFEKVILEYVRDRLKGRDDIDTRRIFVTTPPGGVSPEIVQSVIDEIKKYKTFDEIFTSEASCTISTHCGPVTLGILFYRK